MLKYIVYLTICTQNNYIYVGVHETNPEIFDGYIGNGVFINRPASYKHSKTKFQYAVKTYGVKKFRRITLAEFDTQEEAYELEKKIVTDDFLKRENVYNMCPGGLCNTKTIKEIHMYSLDGEYVKSFNSMTEAARYLDPNHYRGGHLSRAIKLGHQFLGYQFSYEKVPFMKKLKHRKMNSVEKPNSGKRVGRFSVNGELLQEYDNMTLCVKDGYKNAKLVAQGKRNYCKGFIFKYLD